MKTFRNFVQRTTRYVHTDVWQIPVNELPLAKSIPVRVLRIFIMATKGFDKDKCALRASALTFYSLLSIVPVAAMAFGIAKGFGFEKMFEEEIYEQFAGQEEVMRFVIQFAESLLENTRGGVIAGIGLAVLFWAVIKVLSQIESSLNDIWGVIKQRSLGRKFSDYLAVMLISPVLVILAGSATVFVTTQVTRATEEYAFLSVFSQAIFFALKIIPYMLIWILFTILYILMPNTKVRFGPGIFAGVLAGTAYQLVQWGYIAFQVGAAKYNAVYGSFAALPLFLIWLQLSWLIVLYGAEISFAAQNGADYEFEPHLDTISSANKRLISLAICRLAVQGFAAGERPLTAVEIAHRLGLPSGLAKNLLAELVESRVLSVTETGTEGEPAFQPARDIHTLSISAVVKALDRRGGETLPAAEASRFDALSEAMTELDARAADSPANRLLKDV